MPDQPLVQTLQPEGCSEVSPDTPQTQTVLDRRTSQAGQQVYDESTLNELEDIFGRTRLMDLLGRLRVEIAQRLHVSTNERDVLGHDAHTLLSVSGSLGFVNLSQRCSEVEQAYLRGGDLAAPLEAARRAAGEAIAAIGALEDARTDPI